MTFFPLFLGGVLLPAEEFVRVSTEISNVYDCRIALTQLCCWRSKKASAVPALTLSFVLAQAYVRSCGERIGQLIVSKLTWGKKPNAYAAFPVQFTYTAACLCLLAQEEDGTWKEIAGREGSRPLTVLQLMPPEGGCVKL